MATREQVLAEARSWLGTPFHHQGRLKGVGVDCIGLVVGVARALGMAATDRPGYARTPDGETLTAALDAQMRRIKAADAGDVLLLRIRRLPQHVGFLGEGGTLIHAHSGADKVVETPMTDRWWERVVAAYRFIDMED